MKQIVQQRVDFKFDQGVVAVAEKTYEHTMQPYDMMRVIGRDPEKNMVLMGGFGEIPGVWFSEDEHFNFSKYHGYREAKYVAYPDNTEKEDKCETQKLISYTLKPDAPVVTKHLRY